MEGIISLTVLEGEIGTEVHQTDCPDGYKCERVVTCHLHSLHRPNIQPRATFAIADEPTGAVWCFVQKSPGDKTTDLLPLTHFLRRESPPRLFLQQMFDLIKITRFG